MTIDEAIEYFKSGNKLCCALGIQRQNITQWRKQGYIPAKLQIRIEELTGGRIKASTDQLNTKECFHKWASGHSGSKEIRVCTICKAVQFIAR